MRIHKMKTGHRKRFHPLFSVTVLSVLCASVLSPTATPAAHPAAATEPEEILVPEIDGPWWQVAGNPDLGSSTSPDQEPVDFGVWRAADGTWQLWSCIRKTNCGGNTRLFHGWQGEQLTDSDWKPLGIVMQADPKYGESPGGLQAPHVILRDGTFYMFYGDWANICLATSCDGKSFQRQVRADGKTGMFNEGSNEHARDPMVLPVGDRYHCYYTAHSVRSPAANHRGVNYCRISPDLRNWGPSKVLTPGLDGIQIAKLGWVAKSP